MRDNLSNPSEITQKSPRNRIWKDPFFWKGFLLGTGKDNVSICPTPEIGFGKTLSFGRVFYWVRERIMSQYVLPQKISESDLERPFLLEGFFIGYGKG